MDAILDTDQRVKRLLYVVMCSPQVVRRKACKWMSSSCNLGNWRENETIVDFVLQAGWPRTEVSMCTAQKDPPVLNI